MGIFKKFEEFQMPEADLVDEVEIEGMEEEEDSYIGIKKLKELAKALGVQYMNGNSISYEGQKISFFSETEKFHVGKKKFRTVDEVVSYLNANGEETVEEEAVQEPVEESLLTKKFKDFK